MIDYTSLSAAAAKSEDSVIVQQMTLVNLDKDALQEYKRFFIPRKTSAFASIADDLASVSARLNGFMALLRYCLTHSRRLSNVDVAERDKIINEQAARIFENVMHVKGLKDGAKDFLTSMSTGNNHVIQPSTRYKGGYDIHFLGDLVTAGADAPMPTLNIRYNEFPVMPCSTTKLSDNVPYIREKMESYSTELSLGCIKTGEAIISALFGPGAVDAKQATKRFHKPTKLDFDFESLNDLFHTYTGVSLTTEFMKNIPVASVRAFSKYVAMTFVRTPNRALLRLIPHNDVGTFDASEYIPEEALACSQTLSVSFSITLPEQLVRYITQSPEGEAVSVAALHNWVSIWTKRYVKAKGARTVGGRIRLIDLPSFVLPISKSKNVTELRRTNGYAVEQGKTNADNIFIGANGGLHYGPQADQRESISANLSGYEAAVENYLAFCFENGVPPQSGSSMSDELVRSIGNREALETSYAKVHSEIRGYSGKILSYDWDYNTVLTANVEDPSSTVADNIIGAARVDTLTLADYLGYNFAESGEAEIKKSFADSLVLMLNLPMAKNDTPRSVIGTESYFVDAKGPTAKLIAFYQALTLNGTVPLIDDLLKRAVSELNLTSLKDAPYRQASIYNGVLNDNLTFAVTPSITTLLLRTANHCGGSSTLLSMIAEENEGLAASELRDMMPEHPHYFEPSKSRMADFGNMYNYIGGKVFQLACEELTKVDPAKLFGTIPNDSTSYNVISKLIMPQAVMFAKYVPNAEAMLAQGDIVAESNKPDGSITEQDIHVSGSKAGAQLFPHQVKTHGSLRRRPAFAVLDIAPGGGKTTLGLTDIAALLHDLDEIGETLKPLVLCPDNLIKNWVDDMKLFTGSGWNMIPITTSIIDRWGYEKLEKLIKDAPKNTIVLAGFNCLTSRSEEIVLGTKKVRVSNNLEFLKRFQFDYICIDESHKLARKTSQRHRAAKQLTTASHVKFLRLASGTFIHGRVSDAIGQSSLYNGHIFREGDVLSARDDEVMVNGEAIPVWKVDTPSRARAKLARYAAVVTLKKKHWAFMLPSPVETFFPVPLVPRDGDGATEEEIRLGELHQKLYDVVLHESLEELEKLMKNTKVGKEGDDDDDDDEGEEGDEEETEVSDDDAGDLDLDDAELNGLSQKDLTPYIARLERLITNPMADPLAPTVFGAAGLTHYNSTVARRISQRIDEHFNVRPWNRDTRYHEYTLVNHEGKLWLSRKLNRGQMGKVLMPESAVGIEPQNNPDLWREEPEGKIIVFCRYTNSVNGVYDALPEKYKKITVKYTGQEENKAANLDAFKTDPRVKILIANEMGISEGHNLQNSSRIIRVESPWNPGDLDQSASRIFRPDPAASKAMFDSGKAGELYREIVFLDWIVCDGTLHVQKQARLIAKIFNKARFDEADNPLYRDVLEDHQLEEIPMSLDILRSRSTLEDYAEYVNAYGALNGVLHKEFQEMRDSIEPDMRDLPVTPAVKGSYKIDTPFISNQKPEDVDNIGLISLRQMMRHDDVLADPETIIGQPVVSDMGKGRIAKVKFRYLRKAILDINGDPVYKTTATGRTLQTELDLDKNGKMQLDTRNPIVSVTIKTVDDEVLSFNDPGLLFIPTKLTSKTAPMFAVRNLATTEAQQRKLDREEAAEEEDDEKALIAEERRRKRERRDLEDRNVSSEHGKKRKQNLERGRPINEGIKRVKQIPALHELPDVNITVHPAYYHGYLTLEVRSDEVEPGALKKLKFKHTGPYVYVTASRYAQFDKILDYLDAHFEYSAQSAKRLEAIQDAFESGGKEVYRMELAPVATLPYFFATSRKKVTNRKEVRPYPIILPNQLQLAIDPATCPVINKHIGQPVPGASTKWTKHEGHELFFAPGKTELRAKLKELEAAGYTITNKDEALAEISNIKFRAAKSTKA